MKKKRILHVVSELGTGGVESMLMNIYRNINTQEFQFDFLVHNEPTNYIKEIKDLGGNIHIISNKKNLGYFYNLYNIMKFNGKYDAVHAHISLNNGIILLIAKLAKIDIRISHSHLTSYHRLITKLVSPIFKLLISISSTKKVACGNEAGNHLYGKKSFTVIPNAINLDLFLNENNITQLKREDGKIVIGFIGRLTEQKNPFFVINLAKYIKDNYSHNFQIKIVGEGHLEESLIKLIEQNNLENNITLLGPSKEIHKLLHDFNVVLLPSLFEGLPVVAIEAQATGTPILMSDTITREADLGLGLVEYLSLNENYEIWTHRLFELGKKSKPSNESIIEVFNNKGYNASLSNVKIKKLYE